MKKLTVKQEKFANLYVELGNASEAYRRSYDCSKTKDEVVHVKASELMSNGNVSVRVEELRLDVKEEHGIDRAFILKGYLEIISDVDYTFKLGKDNNLTKEDSKAFYRIMQQTKNTDKLRALESISKMLGLNAPEEISHTHTIKKHETKWG